MSCLSFADNIQIDVNTSSLQDSLDKTSLAAAAGGSTDCRQPMTTGDDLPPGSTEAVTCNGTEVRVDVNVDVDGILSSEEAGGV